MSGFWPVLGMCVLIVLARVADVSLGTLRTVAVINGRRATAWFLGFFEVLIWVLVVSQVISHVQREPVFAVAYAFGFAMGTFVGITIERRIAYGDQVVRVFSRKGHEIATALRASDFRVTEFEGKGRDGAVSMLFIETQRKRTREVSKIARQYDPKCYLVIDDIRHSSVASEPLTEPTGWRAKFQKK
jgi:uncharacterized protein YebE (UPF0316 family)